MRASLSARKLARQPRSSLTCSAHWHARTLGRRRPGRAGCAAAAHHQAGARPPAARRSPPRSPPSQGCASQLHKQGAQQSTAHSTRRRARSTRRLTRESNTHTRTARAHRTPAQRCTQSTLDHTSGTGTIASERHHPSGRGRVRPAASAPPPSERTRSARGASVRPAASPLSPHGVDRPQSETGCTRIVSRYGSIRGHPLPHPHVRNCVLHCVTLPSISGLPFGV